MTDASALMKAAAATHGYGATTTVDEERVVGLRLAEETLALGVLRDADAGGDA